MLPVMLETAARFPELEFVIAGAPSVDEAYYRQFMGQHQVPIEFGKTYSILAGSAAALVTSGTATLETGLLGIPQAVCYRDRLLVHVFIQYELTADRLQNDLKDLLYNETRRQELKQGYTELKNVLGGSGASQRVAELIYDRF
eukprot:gene15397-19655_t